MAKSKTTPVVSSKKNTSNTADLLNELNDLVPAKAKPKAGAKDRWELELSKSEAETFNRWIQAKVVSEIIDARLDSSKDDLCEVVMDKICQQLWKNKVKPTNPDLVIKVNGQVDCKSLFMCQDKFKYRFPEIPENANNRDFFIETFVNLGLEEGDAERLVDTELDFNPIVGIRPLSELLNGRYGEKRAFIESSEVEQEAGRKLMMMLKAQAGEDGFAKVEPFTADERAAMIVRENGVKVKSEFYNRVCTYCHSVDQLKAIFKVIVPIAYPQGPKFAVNDSPDNRAKRLVNAAADIIGVDVVTA